MSGTQGIGYGVLQNILRYLSRQQGNNLSGVAQAATGNPLPVTPSQTSPALTRVAPLSSEYDVQDMQQTPDQQAIMQAISRNLEAMQERYANMPEGPEKTWLLHQMLAAEQALKPYLPLNMVEDPTMSLGGPSQADAQAIFRAIDRQGQVEQQGRQPLPPQPQPAPGNPTDTPSWLYAGSPRRIG